MQCLLAFQEIIKVIELTAQYVSDYILQFSMPEFTGKLSLEGSTGRDPQVELQLARLEDALRRGDGETAIIASKGFAEDAQRQIDFANDLASKKSGLQKANLLSDASLLNQLVPQILQAATRALKNGDVLSLEEARRLIAKAKEVNRNIENAKKAERELLEAAARLADLLNGLTDAVEKGNPQEAAKQAKLVAEAIQHQIEIARNVANYEIKNPVYKQQILDAIEELERLLPEIVSATKESLLDPNNLEKRKRLHDIQEKN